MKTFKLGDLVTHALHGSATVVGIEENFNLVTIRPEFYRDGNTKAVHPISLTLVEKSDSLQLSPDQPKVLQQTTYAFTDIATKNS